MKTPTTPNNKLMNIQNLTQLYRDLPIVIEVGGMPRLGKTTFSDSFVDWLKRQGYKTRLSKFATHSSPIDDRWSFDFSAWTYFSFLRWYLELRHSSVQFMIADRGIFDALVWLRVKKNKGMCMDSHLLLLRNVAFLEPWVSSLRVVVVFIGDHIEIMDRLESSKLYQGESAVTNLETLQQLEKAIREESKVWKEKGKNVILFNTAGMSLREVLVRAKELVIDALASPNY